MKKKIVYFVATVICCMGISACDLVNEEDETPANVYEQIKGTWSINKIYMLGAGVPGDGSTLSFEDCDEPPCTGHDYKSSDGTTGTFTYEFIENDSEIVIVDEDDNGGNYNTTWSVLDFESGELRITGEFGIFGNMLLEMSK